MTMAEEQNLGAPQRIVAKDVSKPGVDSTYSALGILEAYVQRNQLNEISTPQDEDRKEGRKHTRGDPISGPATHEARGRAIGSG